MVSFLDNALRFAPPGTTVGVRCTAVGSECRIDVVDPGPGVVPARREQIFEPFVRGDGEGSGLGLAIARSFVEAHEGTLTVEPTPGGGATFVVRIPGVETTT